MRILWIDDEPSRYRILASRTNMWDHQVMFAHGYDQIKHYLANDTIDIVFLDGDMPQMDGRDVAREFLRERNIPVVIISANEGKAQEMANILTEYATPHRVAPITLPQALVQVIQSFDKLRVL